MAETRLLNEVERRRTNVIFPNLPWAVGLELETSFEVPQYPSQLPSACDTLKFYLASTFISYRMVE